MIIALRHRYNERKNNECNAKLASLESNFIHRAAFNQFNFRDAEIQFYCFANKLKWQHNQRSKKKTRYARDIPLRLQIQTQDGRKYTYPTGSWKSSQYEQMLCAGKWNVDIEFI